MFDQYDPWSHSNTTKIFMRTTRKFVIPQTFMRYKVLVILQSTTRCVTLASVTRVLISPSSKGSRSRRPVIRWRASGPLPRRLLSVTLNHKISIRSVLAEARAVLASSRVATVKVRTVHTCNQSHLSATMLDLFIAADVTDVALIGRLVGCSGYISAARA
jgi:hypothetical protein